MAAVADRIAETAPDRRMLPRSEVNLGVTLHRVGEAQAIPGAIANLSATGFLAELPAGASLPEFLDVDLPNAGRRKAQVVWQSGAMAGCNFTTSIGKSDLSAARLKSAFSEAPAQQVPSIDPADPIWDVANQATPGEKWPLPARVAVIATAAVLPWTPLVGLAALLA